jgi:hypothetical protein
VTTVTTILTLFYSTVRYHSYLFRQHDAQEFLSSLLDTLHNEMANSLCALVQPSAISALSLDAKISPASSSAVPSHDYHTPDKTGVDMKMDIEVDNKGTVMVIDNEVIKELEEVEVEVQTEVENSSNASRFFLPKKSIKEMTKNTADNLLSDHSTPPLNDIPTTLTTPERSDDQCAMIDRSTKRSREESFSTPQSRKSLDQSIAHNLNPTLPPTTTKTSTASATPLCAPYVMTTDNLPPFLCNSIPTSKHFHAQVKSTFECLHCGFFREPKMVRSFPVFSFLLCFYSFLSCLLASLLSSFLYFFPFYLLLSLHFSLPFLLQFIAPFFLIFFLYSSSPSLSSFLCSSLPFFFFMFTFHLHKTLSNTSSL